MISAKVTLLIYLVFLIVNLKSENNGENGGDGANNESNVISSDQNSSECSKSDQCDSDEFCGFAASSYVCPGGKKCPNERRDDSVKLCFKLPNVKNKKFLSERKEVGIPVCFSDNDCQKEPITKETKCKETDIQIRRADNTQPHEYLHVCAKIVVIKESYWLVSLSVSGAIVLVILSLGFVGSFFFYKYMKEKMEKEKMYAIESEVGKVTEQKDKIISTQKEDLQKKDELIKKKDMLIDDLDKEINPKRRAKMKKKKKKEKKEKEKKEKKMKEALEKTKLSNEKEKKASKEKTPEKCDPAHYSGVPIPGQVYKVSKVYGDGYPLSTESFRTQ